MDEDYVLGISILVVIGSMSLCCCSYFLYVLRKKTQSQEEEQTESLVQLNRLV